MFSENSRKQNRTFRQLLGRQTKHVNMRIRGPVLGRKCIDLIIKTDNSEGLGQRGGVPCWSHFLMHSQGIWDPTRTEGTLVEKA